MENRLWHHGVKGMKWGVRRYQNPDGSLTSAGKARYLQEMRYPDGKPKSNRKIRKERAAMLKYRTKDLKGQFKEQIKEVKGQQAQVKAIRSANKKDKEIKTQLTKAEQKIIKDTGKQAARDLKDKRTTLKVANRYAAQIASIEVNELLDGVYGEKRMSNIRKGDIAKAIAPTVAAMAVISALPFVYDRVAR